MFKVPYTKIVDIVPHQNAHSLEIAKVYDFNVVVRKGAYAVGDSVIYVPVDSILPANIEEILFPPGSKVVLHKHRVRQIRLRGSVSQGMLITPLDVHHLVPRMYLEEDLAEKLNITKYEPPEIGPSRTQAGPKLRKRSPHPLFYNFNGVDNFKWFPNLFKESDEVVAQVKYHGTHIKCAILPFYPRTLWEKLLKFLHLAPVWQKVYGSNNVDISSSMTYKGFYGEDIYGKALKKLKVFDKLKPGEQWHGEVLGPSIQKGYTYGYKEHHIKFFDIKILQEDGTFKWLNPEEAEQVIKERGLDFVDTIYKGPFNKEQLYALSKGPTPDGTQPVTEGIVVKSRNNYNNNGNKTALKIINEDYLADTSNTDHH